MKYMALFLIILAFAACTQDDTPPIPEVPDGSDNGIIEKEEVKSVCKDSEVGTQAGIKGTIQSDAGSFIDSCKNEKTLMEYYCELGKVKSKELICEGYCDDGVCKVPETGCTDSDIGTFYEIKGSVTDINGEVFDDHCKNGLIYEAICDTYGYGKYKTKDCDVCDDGVCIAEDAVNPIVAGCYDSDGGSFHEIKGTTTDSKGRNETDSCMGPKQLEEWYCDSYGYAKSRVTRCICEDGVCIGPA